MASETIRYRTKRMLADALQEVMRRKQLDQITIADIIKTCGVSRKAFYYHFEDIYDLTNWALQEEWEKMSNRSGTDLAGSLQLLIDYFQNNRPFCLAIMNSSQNYRMENLFADKITDAIRQRIGELESYKYKSDKEIYLQSECCCIAVVAMLGKWLKGELKCTDSELVSYMKETITPLSDIL